MEIYDQSELACEGPGVGTEKTPRPGCIALVAV